MGDERDLLGRSNESESLPWQGRQMTKRFMILFLLIGILFLGCNKDEIYYEGKSTSKWIKMLRDKDPDKRRSAAVALGNIGTKSPKVLPALIGALEDRDRVVRVQAIIALGEIGPQAREAVPALTALVSGKDKWVSLHAVSALGKMGQGAKDAVPALIAALKEPDRNVRLHAVGALGEMGPQAREAVPALIEALRDIRIREATLEALEKIGLETPEAAPALVSILRVEGLYAFAAENLVAIGRQAVPPLIRALQGQDLDNRETAARILADIGPQARAAVPALIEALTDQDRGLRVQAAITLGEIGPSAKEAVPALFEALKDPKTYEASMRALERIGFDSKVAIPELIEALKYEDLRTYAAQGLLDIGPETIPELIRALEGDYGPVQAYAAWILGKMGPDAKAAVPALTDALWDRDKQVRGTAQWALQEIKKMR